jgi:hypothetical protein
MAQVWLPVPMDTTDVRGNGMPKRTREGVTGRVDSISVRCRATIGVGAPAAAGSIGQYGAGIEESGGGLLGRGDGGNSDGRETADGCAVAQLTIPIGSPASHGAVGADYAGVGIAASDGYGVGDSDTLTGTLLLTSPFRGPRCCVPSKPRCRSADGTGV